MKYVHLCTPGYCKEYRLPYPCTEPECDNVEMEPEPLSCGLCGKVSPFMEDSDELVGKREWLELDDAPVLEKNGDRWCVTCWGTTDWGHNRVSEVWCEPCFLAPEATSSPQLP